MKNDFGTGNSPSILGQVLDLITTAPYLPDTDPWLPRATTLVEESLDYLLDEFIRLPYLHRVEHSLHTQLFYNLMQHFELSQRVSIGNNLGTTQLIHKEWPETICRGENRRGNFDLVVLPPLLLQSCSSIRAFRDGRLDSPIVIEIGLDYSAAHLASDAAKLINSKPKHGYLVHFVRERPKDPAAEDVILGIQAKYGIKTIYAWIAGGKMSIKRVNDSSITESDHVPNP